MNTNIVRMDAEDAQAAPGDGSQPIKIGPRLRSTMADEYAAPFLAEINRLQAKLDEAVKARDEALKLASSLAGRVAHEHQRRGEAEKVLRSQWESSTEPERLRLVRQGVHEPRR